MSVLNTKKEIFNIFQEESIELSQLITNLQIKDKNIFKYSIKLTSNNIKKFTHDQINSLITWLIDSEYFIFAFALFCSLEKIKKINKKNRNLIEQNIRKNLKSIEFEEKLEIIDFLAVNPQNSYLDILYFLSNDESSIIKIKIIKIISKIDDEQKFNYILKFLNEEEKIRIEALFTLVINNYQPEKERILNLFIKGSTNLQLTILDRIKSHSNEIIFSIIRNAIRIKEIRDNAIGLVDVFDETEVSQILIKELSEILTLLTKNKQFKENKSYGMKYLHRLMKISINYRNESLKEIYIKLLKNESFPFFHYAFEGIKRNSDTVSAQEFNYLTDLVIKNIKLLDYFIPIIESSKIDLDLTKLNEIIDKIKKENEIKTLFKSIFKNEVVYDKKKLKDILEKCGPKLSEDMREKIESNMNKRKIRLQSFF